MDEMAEAVGMDPVKFRLLNVQKPGTKVAIKQGGPTVVPMPEMENGTCSYDCYASVEVLEEGAKAIGWDKRNPVPGGNPGRFKRGIWHGHVPASRGTCGLSGRRGRFRVDDVHKRQGGRRRRSRRRRILRRAELEINADGHVVMHYAPTG